MKRKSIKEIIEEINNIEEKEELYKWKNDDEFELYLKEKKKDCENIWHLIKQIV